MWIASAVTSEEERIDGSTEDSSGGGADENYKEKVEEAA